MKVLKYLSFVSFLLSAELNSAPLLYAEWVYRMPIIINNEENTTVLTEYQILVIIDSWTLITEGKLRPDAGDIRFASSDGETELNYWIESGINTTSTRIWVRVPAIPSLSIVIIHIYYGNPDAVSESSGDATFELFDNFKGTSLDASKWTTQTANGAIINVEEGYVKLISGTGSIDRHARIYSISTFSTGVEMITKVKSVFNSILGNGQKYGFAASGSMDTGQHMFLSKLIPPKFGLPNLDNMNQFRLTSRQTACTASSILLNATFTDPLVHYFKWTNDYLEVSVGSSVTGKTDQIPNIPLPLLFLVSNHDQPGTDKELWIDYVRIRKYTDPEPTIILGEEEKNKIRVDVDIKPGSFPNPLNINSKGVFPVAILGTQDLNVNEIDNFTIELEGVPPVRWNIEDVSGPVENGNECNQATAVVDGFDDLTLKFKTHDVISVLDEVENGDEIFLILTGKLLDGTPIEGRDCILINSSGGKLVKSVSQDEMTAKERYMLNQNNPNPFNSETVISYSIPEKSDVILNVFNVVGKKVRTLVDTQMYAGHHSVIWDGRDDYGRAVSDGIYFYGIYVGAYRKVMRMLLLK